VVVVRLQPTLDGYWRLLPVESSDRGLGSISGSARTSTVVWRGIRVTVAILVNILSIRIGISSCLQLQLQQQEHWQSQPAAATPHGAPCTMTQGYVIGKCC
jgi:hypothetical protein